MKVLTNLPGIEHRYELVKALISVVGIMEYENVCE